MEPYDLTAFCKDRLAALLKKEFPYLEFKVDFSRRYILEVGYKRLFLSCGVTIKGTRLYYSNKNWDVKNDITALRRFKEFIIRDPSLAFAHCEYKMKQLDEKLEKIITMLTYAPGGPGYEAAKSDFEQHL
nr:hypothetical protein K-LCC10_0287 [Kaumoebavirus]